MSISEYFSHYATVLGVKNVELSIDFYTKKLGFEVSFTDSESPSYAVLVANSIQLHLTQLDSEVIPAEHTQVYIFVFDIESIYIEMINMGVEIIGELTKHDYGMTDFDIKDPDGHIISFGSS